MTYEQYLLCKLAEEANEVAQRALKQMQFGKSETQEGQPHNNRHRLTQEIMDLWAVVHLLREIDESYTPSEEEWQTHYRSKKAMMTKYLDLSISLGQVKL